jgi:uncharacterized membrane protein YccC
MTPAMAVSRAGNGFRTLLTPGPRMVDELECVASILLAILLAHLLGARYVAWAAFTGFVLMRSHAAETLLRGIMRIVGTAAGAALALLVLPIAAPSMLIATLATAIVGAIGLYGMLVGKRAYAWLLFGITFEMVVLGKLEHPGTDALDFARTRLLEVIAGTIACVSVSLATTLTARRRWPGARAAPTARIGWHPHAARHAAQAGGALALLLPLHVLFGLGELEQAAVTIMAVMIVPVSGIGASGLIPVSRRLLHRTLGCLAGSLLAVSILLLAHGSTGILIAGTCLGVILGRHIENGSTRFAYVGLQFTLAVIVVLVPDSYAKAEVGPALQRLLSILIGMALLEPVLLVWHALARSFDQPGTGVAPNDE